MESPAFLVSLEFYGLLCLCPFVVNARDGSAFSMKALS
jgi:hypothetical protein